MGDKNLTNRNISVIYSKPSLRIGLTIMTALVLALAGALLVSCDLWGPAYRPTYKGPFSICVTFAADPVHEATIHYQSLPLKDTPGTQPRVPSAHVFYDTHPRSGDPKAYTQEAVGQTRTIAGLPDGRFIHRVRLTGLEAGHTYFFVVGDDTTGYSSEIRFRTLPGGDAPLRFVVGGDMGGYPPDEYPYAAPLLREAADCDPQFAVIGGDIAYASGDLRRVERWDKWFENWSSLMTTSDGCTIPIVAAMGNHEANDKTMDKPRERAPFYTAFFGEDPPYSYFHVGLADYAVLFILDTNHLVPEAGAQATWLARELGDARAVPIKMAAYHVSMYPAYRAFDHGQSVRARDAWLSLFDQYGLDIAFDTPRPPFQTVLSPPQQPRRSRGDALRRRWLLRR